MQSRGDDIRLDAAWRMAVRVALVASLLAAAAGIALHTFAHVGALPLLFGTALAGTAVGLSLPPARPLRPIWSRPASRSMVRLVPPPEH